MKFETKLIHEGYTPDPTSGAVMPPIYLTSTYAQNSPGSPKGGYEYTRCHNPNFTIFETLIASLEEGSFATCFSSGLGALTALLSTLNPKDTVVSIGGVYGGTWRLLSKVFSKYGINYFSFEAKEVEKAFEKKPKWVLVESITNPLLEPMPIEAIAKLAKKSSAKLIVDNTFATPYILQPLTLGADVVWHSTTKYLGGHSDIVGGVVVTNDRTIKEGIDFARMSLGLNPSPFDVWLATRGTKTLAVRMQKHGENGEKVATFLKSHPKVKRVFYPGLKSQLEILPFKSFGGMVSAEFNMTLEQTKTFLSRLKIFTLAESLGGVESLVCHPALMTHASIPKAERERIGIQDGLIRFSCGIEAAEDLIADIEQGF
jgi:cystathionine beta-lyase/cystathionine gamma-synthase